jgi:hypothetical protein
MRTAALVLGLLVLSSANVTAQQFCKGCGCKGGSGWKINADRGKCLGCDEVATRCRALAACTFTGWEYAKTICAACRQHAPAGLCPLK